MKKARIMRTLGLAAICLLACVGLTQSNFQVFKLSVPEYPWPWNEYPTSAYSVWDEEASVQDVGTQNLYSWSSILDFAEADTTDMLKLSYDWNYIRAFVENNLYTATIPGTAPHWYLASWDLNFYTENSDDDIMLLRPNALAIKRLLLDKGNETVKQKVLMLLVQLLKEDATKQI